MNLELNFQRFLSKVLKYQILQEIFLVSEKLFKPSLHFLFFSETGYFCRNKKICFGHFFLLEAKSSLFGLLLAETRKRIMEKDNR